MQKKETVAENVLIVAPAIAREGITKQVANQIVGMQQQRIRVSLVVLAKSDISILEELGVDLAHVPVLQLMQRDTYLSQRAFFGSLQLIYPIRRFLEDHEVTAVVAHGPYAHFVMRLVKLFRTASGNKFRLIQYFHGLQYSEYPVNSWKRSAMHAINKWLASRYDTAYISVSKVVKQEVMHQFMHHPDHTVIYNTLIHHKATAEVPLQSWNQIQELLNEVTGKYFILLPNRIDSNKGQFFFLNVLDSFLQAGLLSATDIAVLIVGDGPQKEELQEMAKLKGLDGITRFTGAVPNAVVQELMKQADLVVVPSVQEGFSLVALEALQAGALLLTSDAGGLKEVVKNGVTGFMFRSGDEKDCFEKLSMLYQKRNENLIDQEAVKQDLQTRFSFENYMQQLLQILYKA